MKHIFSKIAVLAAASALLSCTANVDNSADIQYVEKQITFEASMADGGSAPGTRTGVDDNGKVYWNINDAISVFYLRGNEGGSKFTNNATEDATYQTQFTGTISVFTGMEGTDETENTLFWAVYPYASNNRCDGTYIYTDLQSEQPAAPGTFCDGMWPTMACTPGLNLGFYNICAGVRFTVSHDDIRSITFRAKGGEDLAGTMKVAWTNGRPDFQGFVEGTGVKDITVTPLDDVCFDNSAVYYAVLPALTLESGLDVIFKTATSQGTYSVASVAFTRGGFKDMQNKDADLTFEPLEGTKTYYPASVVEPGYDYLIVSNGNALKNNDGTADVAEVTFNGDNVFMMEDASILWTAAKPETTLTEGTYTFTNNGKSFYRISSSGNFSLGINAAPASVTKYYLWDYKENHLTHTSAGSGNATNYYWFYYDEGWKFSYATSIPTTNPTLIFNSRQPQVITFSGDSAEYDLGTSTYTAALPTLSGAQNAVTYVSSDATVASVDNEGNVTPLKRGTVTITATAAGTDECQAAEASYVFTVIDSSAQDRYYVKVTGNEILDGTYLVVYDNYAFNANSSDYRFSVTPENDKILSTAEIDACSIEFSVGQTEGQYFLKTMNGYVYAGESHAITFDNVLNNNYLHAATIQSGKVQLKNGSYNFRYSASSNKYQYSSSNPQDLSLYLLEGSAVAPKADRNLSFASDNVTKTIGDVPFSITSVNALSGVTTDVTYSSNDETVATVSGDIVTIVGTGEATITASAPSDDNYKAGSASFTLTVQQIYSKVMAAPADWTGKYLIVKESENVALAYSVSNSFKTSVSIADGLIISNDLAAYEVTVSKSSLGDGKYDVMTSNGKYIYWYSSAFINDSNERSPNQYYATFGGSDGNFSMYTTRTTSPSDTRTPSVNYITYDGSKFTFNTTTTNTIQIYKVYDGTEPIVAKAERSLVFAADAISKTIGDDPFTNALSGVTSDVTYSSDNQAVATVDENGMVTIVGAGEVTISAYAPETDEYKEGSASFTLAVIDPNAPTEKTYTKVSALTSGKKYIVVYGTNALQNNNGALAGVSVSSNVNGNTMTLPSSNAESLEWTATSNDEKPLQGIFTLNNGSSYLRRMNTSNAAALESYSSSAAGYFVWFLSENGQNLYNLNSTGQYTFYLEYSNGWSADSQTAHNMIAIFEELPSID